MSAASGRGGQGVLDPRLLAQGPRGVPSPLPRVRGRPQGPQAGGPRGLSLNAAPLLLVALGCPSQRRPPGPLPGGDMPRGRPQAAAPAQGGPQGRPRPRSPVRVTGVSPSPRRPPS